VPKYGQTITHKIIGRFGAGHVVLRPASPGTGVIAGGGVRAVLELGGVRDVLTKSLGTQNPINLVKATMDGLLSLRRPEEVAELRGLTVKEVLGLNFETPESGNGAPAEAPETASAAPPAEGGDGSTEAPNTSEGPSIPGSAGTSEEAPATEQGESGTPGGEAEDVPADSGEPTS